jgi:hypothetical protein
LVVLVKRFLALLLLPFLYSITFSSRTLLFSFALTLSFFVLLSSPPLVQALIDYVRVQPGQRMDLGQQGWGKFIKTAPARRGTVRAKELVKQHPKLLKWTVVSDVCMCSSLRLCFACASLVLLFLLSLLL